MSSRHLEGGDDPRPDAWSSFRLDPRTSGEVRASDADRDVAAGAINEAFAEGRLDGDEHSDRLSRAMSARRLGDLVPLLADLPPVVRQPGAALAPAPPPRTLRVRSAALRSWLGLALLFNVIWLLTSIGGGWYYYWPVWPMLGTAIPLVVTWIAGGRTPDDGAGGPPRPELR